MTASDTLGEALSLATLGWRVVPITPGAKHPRMVGWQNVATNDATTITNWFSGIYADHGIGVATGLLPNGRYLFVLDVDEHRPEASGSDTLHELETVNGSLPATVEVLTGSGGRHIYMTSPGPVYCHSGKPGPGLDVRGVGGQAVAPPTIHPNGRPYSWLADHGPQDIPVAEAPAWLLELLEAKAEAAPMAEADRKFTGTPSTMVDASVGWWLLHADEGRHGRALETVTKLQRFHQLQHPGVPEALQVVRSDFIRRVTGDKSRTLTAAEREWSDMVRDAAKLVASTPATSPLYQPDDTDDDTATPTSPAHVELDALLAEQDEGYDWLIPGLLETGDRLILTGLEGRGKSTLLRQIAVQVTSGLHPFTGGPITPLTVTYVDLENSRRQVRRKVAALREVAGERYDGRLHFVFRPEGLNLASGVDFAWLDDQLAATQPDLCVIGPLYKCMAGDPTQEVTAMAVAARLDELRVRYNCALLVEAHSPYADGGKSKRPTRPYGASLWSRWPEFGIHLAPDGELEHWRGPRDERTWPASLRRGEPWPWMPAGEVEAEAWDGPRACMAAVAQVLTDAGAVNYSANELCRTMRTLGHRFRDRTVREAADRLALDGRVTVSTGPRNSRRYAITTVTDTLGTNDEPF